MATWQVHSSCLLKVSLQEKPKEDADDDFLKAPQECLLFQNVQHTDTLEYVEKTLERVLSSLEDFLKRRSLVSISSLFDENKDVVSFCLTCRSETQKEEEVTRQQRDVTCTYSKKNIFMQAHTPLVCCRDKTQTKHRYYYWWISCFVTLMFGEDDVDLKQTASLRLKHCSLADSCFTDKQQKADEVPWEKLSAFDLLSSEHDMPFNLTLIIFMSKG